MRIYFDSCAVQRPLDSANHIRIALEVEALLGVFALVESGQYMLVSSEVLDLETERIVSPIRKYHAARLLDQAAVYVKVTDTIEQRARHFTENGIQPMDALHLACAEDAQCDLFCTCDDRFLARAKAIQDLKTIAVSPLELVEELDI